MATLLGETVDDERVPRDVVEWHDERDALEVRGHERGEDGKEEGEKEEEQQDEDPLSPEMISLEVALKTCCFEGFEGKRMTFLSTTQLTCSNVMSTVVTARPIDTSSRRKTHKPLSSKASNNQHESSSTTETAMHVYAQPSGPAKKVKRKNGKYQAQLPSFQRSLPALPIPVSRLNRELRDERDKFMAQLQRERAEKAALDNWAATKIQASFRGFRARPRVVSYETRKRLNTMSSIRLDLSDMEHSRMTAAPLVVTDDSTDQRDDPAVPAPWRKEIQSRAAHKREFRATKEHRHYAATRAQALVRGFLARCAFARRFARHMDELFHRAIVRIQSMFRAFRLRVRIAAVVAKLQLQAAIQIQSLIRGIQARERVLTLTFERKCAQRRRAGEPLQFTLPQRTHEIVRTSCLRVLFAHRKTPQQRAFKSAAWHDERQLLQIYKVSTKLNAQRQWLLRMTLVTPAAKKRKKPRGALTRQPSRLTGRIGSMSMLVNGPSTPSSPSNARRGAPPAGFSSSASSPVGSRPSSPSNTVSLSSRTLLTTSER